VGFINFDQNSDAVLSQKITGDSFVPLDDFCIPIIANEERVKQSHTIWIDLRSRLPCDDVCVRVIANEERVWQSHHLV
jgi:hypothetical protein